MLVPSISRLDRILIGVPLRAYDICPISLGCVLVEANGLMHYVLTHLFFFPSHDAYLG